MKLFRIDERLNTMYNRFENHHRKEDLVRYYYYYFVLINLFNPGVY